MAYRAAACQSDGGTLFHKGRGLHPPPPPAHPYFVQAALSYESCPNPIMHDACIVPLPQHPQQRLSHPHQQHSHRLGRSQQHLPWHLLACRPPIAYRWSESTHRSEWKGFARFCENSPGADELRKAWNAGVCQKGGLRPPRPPQAPPPPPPPPPPTVARAARELASLRMISCPEPLHASILLANRGGGRQQKSWPNANMRPLCLQMVRGGGLRRRVFPFFEAVQACFKTFLYIYIYIYICIFTSYVNVNNVNSVETRSCFFCASGGGEGGGGCATPPPPPHTPVFFEPCELASQHKILSKPHHANIVFPAFFSETRTVVPQRSIRACQEYTCFAGYLCTSIGEWALQSYKSSDDRKVFRPFEFRILGLPMPPKGFTETL